MRSEGFPFYSLGVWGWRRVRWTPFWCSQPFATVHNRPQPSATVCERLSSWQKVAVPMGGSARRVIFGGFKRQTLRDMWMCLVTCRTSFCLAGAILLRRCQKMSCIFEAGVALWTCPASFCVAGAAFQTSRVTCFLRFALSRLREVVTKCKFRGRTGIL